MSETHQRMREAREASGITRAEMAEILNRTERTVARIENNEVPLTLDLVKLYANVTKANFEHLVLGKDPLFNALVEIRKVREEMVQYIQNTLLILDDRLLQLERIYIERYGSEREDYSE